MIMMGINLPYLPVQYQCTDMDLDGLGLFDCVHLERNTGTTMKY